MALSGMERRLVCPLYQASRGSGGQGARWDHSMQDSVGLVWDGIFFLSVIQSDLLLGKIFLQ